VQIDVRAEPTAAEITLAIIMAIFGLLLLFG
jgi:hypothetical protein